MTASPAHDRIGSYELGPILGHGARGIVYQARRLEAPRRAVALKVVDLRSEDPLGVQRFDAECDALARLDHPGIARVYDAGRVDDDRGFIAMELAAGLRIDLHCDRRAASIRTRLELFHSLARALGHAHERGVVHRDVKPANVLVTEVDGVPRIKLIDFGIARDLDRRDAFTDTGEFLGTEAYVSPEQARAIDAPVDARSDVYSLGVVLFLLLTGDLPFEESSAHHPAVSRRAEGQAPRRPSATFVGDDATHRAERRGSTPRAMQRELAGDLDWIVLRALESRPEDRYATAHEFAREIERYLAGRPVLATPPTLGRKVGRFVSRHRSLVYSTSVLVIALLWYSVSATRVAFAARRSESVALESLKSASIRNELVHGLLNRSTADIGNLKAGGRLVPHLDEARSRAVAELADQPEDRAILLGILGTAYENIGEYERQEETLERAVQAWEQAPVRDPMAYGTVQRDLGRVYRRIGRLNEAAEMYDLAIETLRRATPAFEGSCKALAQTHYAAGMLGTATNDLEGAEEHFDAALAIVDEHVVDEPMFHAFLSRARARVAWTLGELDDAERGFERTIEIADGHFSENDDAIASFHSDLALVRIERGSIAEAEEPSRKALEIADASLGSRRWAHSLYVASRFEWALASKEFDVADELLERWIELRPSSVEVDALRADLYRARVSFARTLQNDRTNAGAAFDELQRAAEASKAIRGMPKTARRRLEAEVAAAREALRT